jgi:hypothetical protein
MFITKPNIVFVFSKRGILFFLLAIGMVFLAVIETSYQIWSLLLWVAMESLFVSGFLNGIRLARRENKMIEIWEPALFWPWRKRYIEAKKTTARLRPTQMPAIPYRRIPTIDLELSPKESSISIALNSYEGWMHEKGTGLNPPSIAKRHLEQVKTALGL